jgi:hypothetical protein
MREVLIATGARKVKFLFADHPLGTAAFDSNGDPW